ncbi:HPr kinase/phosphorylase [Methylobacterium sp. J-090]|uniref:HPr kinase/phosphorylase n=1 Tax=Methylobacterium sp. J-090 TaxID=2836666 RepID=UPI001FB8D2CD|nr:serine kinase [Methylobacterium sp. J-090]MCJ2081304.1 serine kinase [Methylobacterium sp. J-090]
MNADTIHATALVLDGAGVLIRGDSGSGKSTLALLLLDRAAMMALPASLVGDDRIRLVRESDTLLARPHPALRDGIEVRGLGLCRAVAGADAAPLRLVVDLVARGSRLPEAPAPANLLGVSLPRLVLDRRLLRSGLAPRLVLDALTGTRGGRHTAILRLPGVDGP